MNALFASIGFVVLAEMGDKTQLLAMALACRFRWQTVMLGVFVATLGNHFLAVVAGTYLTRLIPLDYVRIAAFASFILFGFWTLRGDKLEGEDKRFNFSPFWTVAVAFFLAEMGIRPSWPPSPWPRNINRSSSVHMTWVPSAILPTAWR